MVCSILPFHRIGPRLSLFGLGFLGDNPFPTLWTIYTMPSANGTVENRFFVHLATFWLLGKYLFSSNFPHDDQDILHSHSQPSSLYQLHHPFYPLLLGHL